MLVKFAVTNYRGFHEFDLGHPRKYEFNAFAGATMKSVDFNYKSIISLCWLSPFIVKSNIKLIPKLWSL